MSNRQRHTSTRCERGNGMRPTRSLAVIGLVAVAAVLAAGCSGEEAVPVDPANPPVLDDGASPDGLPSDVTHPISATPEMENLARQQCLDDPTLAEGYVKAVDPESEAVMSEVVVDCSDVRSNDNSDDDDSGAGEP